MQLPQTSALINTVWRDSSDSTNTELAELARTNNLRAETLLLTDRQTAGKGRLGRTWEQPTGTGIAVSVLLPNWRAAAGDTDLSWAPIIGGYALYRALDQQPLVKWPNDLLVPGDHERGGLKITGFLCELTPGGVIIGCGINVFGSGADLPDGAASVIGAGLLPEFADVTQGSPEAERAAIIDKILSQYIRELRAALETARADSGRERPWESGLHFDTLGREVRVETAAGTMYGVAQGLGRGGELKIVTSDDVVHEISAADVEHVRKA